MNAFAGQMQGATWRGPSAEVHHFESLLNMQFAVAPAILTLPSS